MQIYPGNHKIVSAEEVTVNDIPLSYLEEKNSTTDIRIDIKKDFCGQSYNKSVFPFQQFDTDDIMLFDNDRKAINDSYQFLKRNGSNYYFEPRNSTEFTPESYNYRFLINKEDRYKNNIVYKLKVGASSLQIAEKLIGIFNNERFRKPTNILINENSILPSSFINQNIYDADFIFVEKTFFNHDITIENVMNSHTNIWMVCDEWKDVLEKDDNIESYVLDNPEIYSRAKYVPAKDSKYKFKTSITIEGFPEKDYDYINLFKDKCPALIIKKENGAFLIATHKSFLDNIEENYSLIYELLMKTYLNGFFETKERTCNISDEEIDCYIKLTNKLRQCHAPINMNRILYEDGFNKDIRHSIVMPVFPEHEEEILYKGMDKTGNISFMKKKKGKDPIKNQGDISVFTPYDTVIYFKKQDNDIHVIEDTLTILHREINGKNYIEISPYRSTIYKIESPDNTLLKIGSSQKQKIVFNHQSKKFEVRDYNRNENRQADGNTIEVGSIQISFDRILSCKDIRTVGGGEVEEFNCDMIDTGSLEGRPYRIGSSFVVRLPKRFEKDKQNIKKELEKHISSGDYFVLLFE